MWMFQKKLKGKFTMYDYAWYSPTLLFTMSSFLEPCLCFELAQTCRSYDGPRVWHHENGVLHVFALYFLQLWCKILCLSYMYIILYLKKICMTYMRISILTSSQILWLFWCCGDYARWLVRLPVTWRKLKFLEPCSTWPCDCWVRWHDGPKLGTEEINCDFHLACQNW